MMESLIWLVKFAISAFLFPLWTPPWMMKEVRSLPYLIAQTTLGALTDISLTHQESCFTIQYEREGRASTYQVMICYG